MSRIELTALLARLQSDEGLKQALKAAKTAEEAIKITSEAGYKLDQEDLIRYKSEHVTVLSDQELEGVAGGRGGTAISNDCCSVAASKANYGDCVPEYLC